MIDRPSGPGEFILSEDGMAWLPLTASPPPPEPAPPTEPTPTPEHEDSTDALPRADVFSEGGDDQRDA